MPMPSPLMNVAVARAAERLPGFKRLPLARLVLIAEVAILAKAHFERLSPAERRRMVLLVKQAKCWPQNLSERERLELRRLVDKVEPRAFADAAAQRFSPLAGRRR
ncbi:MAG: hypothetical protein KGL16_07030 [Acidobacteriota bacterium]|nr:hypothetical protein [Acidobacteriota bacterium]